MITKFGKRFLTNYLAGNVNFSQKDLAFGIGNTTPNSLGNDTRLEFEFYRMPASLSSIDISQTGTDGSGNPIFSYSVIYKATIPQDVAGVISEIGLYPGSRTSLNTFDSKFVTSFENNLNWSDGTYSPDLEVNSPTFTSKVGEAMIKFEATSGQTKEYTCLLNEYDISGYSINDSLAIAYKKSDSHVSSIKVKFYSSDTDYYTATFTPSSGTGDKIQSLSMDNLFNNPTGSPDSKSITKIGVSVTASGGATTAYFDGIRIDRKSTRLNSSHTDISRMPSSA